MKIKILFSALFFVFIIKGAENNLVLKKTVAKKGILRLLMARQKASELKSVVICDSLNPSQHLRKGSQQKLVQYNFSAHPGLAVFVLYDNVSHQRNFIHPDGSQDQGNLLTEIRDVIYVNDAITIFLLFYVLKQGQINPGDDLVEIQHDSLVIPTRNK